MSTTYPGEDTIASLNMKGDLLTTYATTWQPGDTQVVCQDFVTDKPVCNQALRQTIVYTLCRLMKLP
jgi:hypothetical protein